jgi:hypothetical protein
LKLAQFTRFLNYYLIGIRGKGIVQKGMKTSFHVIATFWQAHWLFLLTASLPHVVMRKLGNGLVTLQELQVS